jgi:hypothetical protein
MIEEAKMNNNDSKDPINKQRGYYLGMLAVLTIMRASVYGANGMISGIGMLMGIVVMVLGIGLTGSDNVGLLSLVTTLPFILLAMVLLMKNVKETNGQDLNDVEVN